MARLRFIQALLLSIAIAGGIHAWRRLAEPPPEKLREMAAAPLRRIFGPEVTFDWPFTMDFNRGLEIRNLRVPSTGGLVVREGPDGERELLNGLEADRVTILHDRIALAAGRHVPVRIELEGARLLTHETPDGVALDFPLNVSGQGHPDDVLPEIVVRDVELVFRAQPDSERLRASSVLRVIVDELSLLPGVDGTTLVTGAARTIGLGQDDTPIELSGWIAQGGQQFELEADWDPLQLTPELLDALAASIADPLRQRSVQSGRFTLSLTRSGDKREGAIQPKLIWDSAVDVQMEDLLGAVSIDPATLAQLEELFGKGGLKFSVGDGRVDIESAVSELAGGRVSASGWVMSDTGAFRINFEIKDLRLEDPAVRKALGEDGADLFAEFDPKGVVDAFGHVIRSAEGEIEWFVTVLLEDAELAYIGSVGEDGTREGFPYKISDVTGRVRIRPGIVEFDDIVGFNRGAEVTILGYEGREAWTGGETGRILLLDEGADVRLTVVATDVPMDDELIAAIKGSEFSEMLDEFRLAGVIDKIELDLIKIPAIERTVKTEMRLTLLGEQFVYVPFPLPLEDVSGTVTMRRPVIGTERGRTYAFDVTGWAEGAPIQIVAESREHEERGRMRVTAQGLPLAGAVTEAVVHAPATAEDLGEAWRYLAPSGKADLVVDLPLGEDPDPMHLEATLQQATIRLNAESDAPLEIADLVGQLEVREGGVYLHGLSGAIGGAPVELQGSMLGGVDGRWDITARIENLRLTPSLGRSLAALDEGGSLLPGGMNFESGSRMSFDLHLTREPGEASKLQIDFIARDLDTVIRLPDGSLLSFSGESLEVRGDLLRAHNLRAESEGLEIRVADAEISLGAEDTEFFGHFELAMDRFSLDEKLLDVLPESVRGALSDLTQDRLLRSRALQIDAPRGGPVTLRGDLMFEVPEEVPVGEGPRGAFEFAPLVIEERAEGTTFNGLVLLRGFSMDIGLEVEDLEGRIEIQDLRLGEGPHGHGRISGLTGRIEDLRVEGLSGALLWEDDLLRIPALTGSLAGGAVTGEMVMHTADPVSYEGRLQVTDFDVSRLWADLAPTGPEVSGVGQIRLTFQNRGGEMRDLTAAGTLSIREGRLDDLPVIASIFTLFDELVQAEQRAQFERAFVQFTLEREVIHFNRLHLAGPLFDLPGRGQLDLAGTLDLRFTPDLIKGLLLPGIMQFPVVGDVLHGVLREELLYAIRIRGDVEDPETEVEILPPLGLGRKPKFAGTGSPKLPKRRLPGWFR